jgi:hypothetical protein
MCIIGGHLKSVCPTTASLYATDVMAVAPRRNCMPLMYAVTASEAIALPSSCILFLLRVKGVYFNSRIITTLFGVLWLAILGLSLSLPWSVEGAHIGTTQWCVLVKVKSYAVALGIVNCLFDTCVFIAISARIMAFSLNDGTLRTRARTFFQGRGLNALSRSLLQGGQLYYLFVTYVSCTSLTSYLCSLSISVTIIVLFSGTIITVAPVPPIAHAIFGLPGMVLASAMACRVFRQLRIGLINDFDNTTVTSENVASVHFTRRSSPLVVISGDESHALENSHRGPINIQVAQTTEPDGLPDGIYMPKAVIKDTV